MTVETAQHAVDYVIKEENDTSPLLDVKKPLSKITPIDWQEFWHLFISWGTSGLIIFIVLLILTMSDRSDNLLYNTIIRIDTISLVFSLVLSAGLEQLWNNKRQLKYKLVLIAELILATFGLILYLTYSLWAIYDPSNPYFTERFGVNLLYIIFTIICAAVGFVTRALVEMEDK